MRCDRLAALLAAVALAACGGGEPAPPAEPTSAPTEAPTAPPADPAETGTAAPAITSVTADPRDGTILVGTGPALFRLAPGAKRAERLTGRVTTPGGEAPVSGNLVVDFAGPRDLLASGHPVQEGGGVPENLGLIRSRDHGETWEPVAKLGEADYHELEAAGDVILGIGAESSDIEVSRDGGGTWETRTPPAAPIDVVVDPGDAEHWAVSTEQGTFVSSNGGRSWRPRDTTFGARLLWPAPDALYSLDRNGAVKLSADGGATWRERGQAGGLPSAIGGGRDEELLVGLVGGKIRRSRDGGGSWVTLTTLH
ncbi:MAG TPA: sialidase family protein [Solirubrobacter sp.]|nr:sialidase family protein [Solirubrobacter sp.]